MSSLPSPLRKLLESAVKHARKIATGGARKSLEALAVHEPDTYPHMDEAQRKLRVKLRAQARQLGDGESHSRRGSYEIKHLVEKLAYDQWHRILFARYLLENDLLISPEHGVAVSLDDCEELAPSQGLKDAWAVAARFAAVELPEIFRADDPAGEVELPVEDRKPLIALVTGLPVDVFTAGDSHGWCYQFWQADKKKEINKSEDPRGADEIPAVTQLFTEDYMVDFLLDNTLGAWHAGKVLGANPKLAETAKSEDELRQAVALPGCEWKYLRFTRSVGVSPTGTDERGQDAHSPWRPAAGTFDGWPKTAKELKCLDPCMGSGHFVVAMFERLAALRLAEETLDEKAAVAAVIRENLFGLELDPRCTQIAAFNLALTAWRRVGHCKLPTMNLACSGLAPNTKLEDWLTLAGDNEKLRNGMERLFNLFEKAPVLGSLINPRHGADDMFVADYHEVSNLLQQALQSESPSPFILHPSSLESAVTARGLAKAAEILADQFTLVATNVPYLKRGKQTELLCDYCDVHHKPAKMDLATVFIERCQTLTNDGGSVSVVSPQNWLFQPAYVNFRKLRLKKIEWNFLARLGPGAFETITGEVVNVSLIILSRNSPTANHEFCAVDVSQIKSPPDKARQLIAGRTSNCNQLGQLMNPDARVIVVKLTRQELLKTVATSATGIQTYDSPRFVFLFWEHAAIHIDWVLGQTTVDSITLYSGCRTAVRWEDGRGSLFDLMELKRSEGYSSGIWKAGTQFWGKLGVLVSLMGDIPCSLYLGGPFDNNTAAIVPHNESDLLALWSYCSSPEFKKEVRHIDQSLKVTTNTLEKIPLDILRWREVALATFPDGLTARDSPESTEWPFNGHPDRADQPLHVAVARLLGYQWPRQTGSSFPDCPALATDGLEELADEDGIVCLSATKGEAPAAERLRALLAQAMGKLDLPALLASAGPGGKKGSKSESLEDWLRDEFFEQHCALFHHRPFIWHLWDGHKGGFSALVNYHQLTHANLEKLTYAYLGDWIRRQQSAVDAGESGSDARLQAAKLLQSRLKLILEGEPPTTSSSAGNRSPSKPSAGTRISTTASA